MKNRAMKWVIVAVLILLVGYSGFATYSWLEGERIGNRTPNDALYSNALSLSDIPLVELTDVGSVAESLIKTDVTDEVLRERTIQYLFHARTLFYSSRMLQVLTDDEEYGLFAGAMGNLLDFFIEVNNRLNEKEILMTNLDTLKQMEHILLEIPTVDSLTLADAQELLDLTGNLAVD
jgi:hypothetical protein